jgi:streptogramin lyase
LGNTTPRDQIRLRLATLCAVVLSGVITSAHAEQLPGMGSLAGKVAAPKSVGQLSVYALNTDQSVGYQVFVVDGRYRATNLFPGHYAVTLRGTAGQLNWTLKQQTIKLEVRAGRQSSADFRVNNARIPTTYVGGMSYEGWSDRPDDPVQPIGKIEPYDVVYPPGPGRRIMERICFACHEVSFFPYNVARTFPTGRMLLDKDGWGVTVDRMANGPSLFSRPGKASYWDPGLLGPNDRNTVVDYLAENFGPDSLPRVVQQDSEPKLDPKVLAKAEFVEYRVPNTPDFPKRATHTITFNPDGTIYTLDRGSRGSVLWIDPSTGAHKDYVGHGGGEAITADRDGTVWYGSLRHFDPKTGLMDEYQFEGPEHSRRALAVTSIFDSNGDLWGTDLVGGDLEKWDRKTNSLVWWDIPVLRSRPYGITVDHHDKVWFAEWFSGGVTSFDPKAQQFRHYPLTRLAPTNIRRLGADSKNFIWACTWGAPGVNSAALYRLDPDTGAVEEHKLDILYAHPYDAAPDDDDRIWVATDNHILMFDPTSGVWARYPTPTRTDIARLSITGEGTVWFAERAAGQTAGYGAVAVALYPDKDRIKTFAARYSEKSDHGHLIYNYHGPDAKVTGTVRTFSSAPQNPGAYAAMLKAHGLPVPPADAPVSEAMDAQQKR